jgi:hypothetical protein
MIKRLGDTTVNRLLKCLPIVYLAAGLGCAGLSTQTPEEIVGGRAIAQAEALRRGDFEVALGFMTPSYQSSPRATDYQRNRAGAGGWQQVDLKWVKCDKDYSVCDVRLIIMTVRPPAVMTPIPIPLDDKWLKIGRQWYQYD